VSCLGRKLSRIEDLAFLNERYSSSCTEYRRQPHKLCYPGKERPVSEEPGKFTTIQRIEERVDEVEKKVEVYLANLTEEELNRIVDILEGRGLPLR